MPGSGGDSYKTGQTSRLGIVWWTDKNKNKHVRVEADRTQASNFSVPEIFSSLVEASNWRHDDLFTCDSCIDQEKYLTETGRRSHK